MIRVALILVFSAPAMLAAEEISPRAAFVARVYETCVQLNAEKLAPSCEPAATVAAAAVSMCSELLNLFAEEASTEVRPAVLEEALKLLRQEQTEKATAIVVGRRARTPC